MTYIVELQDRVLAPWGPSSISAVAKLVKEEVEGNNFDIEKGALHFNTTLFPHCPLCALNLPINYPGCTACY